jgi:hypothetical protein
MSSKIPLKTKFNRKMELVFLKNICTESRPNNS